MDSPTITEPSSPATPHSGSYGKTPAYNPYQRVASRRAISCVTCAKAKTKCDKGFPSCSRCITKGIKCDPRSTRRTSDNSHRANIRKPFVAPKRYRSASNLPLLNRHDSPRSTPSLKRPQTTRAASHIDFRTAVKMSQQQAPACSGLPKLTPLTICASRVVDERYSYSSSTDQDATGYTSAMTSEGITNSGCLTPQTPDSLVYHEPIAIDDISDTWMLSQPWSDDSQASIGLGLDCDIPGLLPEADLWSTSEHAYSTPVCQVPWVQSYLSGSPQSTISEFACHSRGTPSLSISECSVDDFSDPAVFHEDWANYQPTPSQLNMAHMVTSAPFMHNVQSVPVAATGWDDGFMYGPGPCLM